MQTVCVIYVQVTDTESLLTTWTSSVIKLRNQHEWLLFFSIPKQLLLYQLIQEWKEEDKEKSEYQLLREVMFLISNDPPTREQFRKHIEVNE